MSESRVRNFGVDNPTIPIMHLLERIATALEEQNRIQHEWIAVNTTWHTENQESDIGPRIVAIHEENARREHAHREDMREMMEKEAREQNEIIRATHKAYLESLRRDDGAHGR